MKSILIFLIGFFVGILFLWQSLVLADKYQTWKKARMEPMLIEIAGCGDDGYRQVMEGK